MAGLDENRKQRVLHELMEAFHLNYAQRVAVEDLINLLARDGGDK